MSRKSFPDQFLKVDDSGFLVGIKRPGSVGPRIEVALGVGAKKFIFDFDLHERLVGFFERRVGSVLVPVHVILHGTGSGTCWSDSHRVEIGRT